MVESNGMPAGRTGNGDDAGGGIDVDVVIIGAGISGIGTAIELGRRETGKTFTILEARDAIGGTWDLFRYPGIRSDSDVQTFSYGFKPWTGDTMIAPGEEIRDYVREAAREYDVEDKIRFRHKVTGADWDSTTQSWAVTCEVTGADGSVRTEIVHATWLFNASGYYRYDKANNPELPGRENFEGEIIHPQYWTEGFDYSGKKIVVLGSGATAVTLIPSLADKAESVTMLQRTPTYMFPLPRVSPLVKPMRKLFGVERAHHIMRAIHIEFQATQYAILRRFPAFGRKFIEAFAKRYLPKGYPMDPNFTPPYNPWDQRLCVVPDGDLFTVIAEGKADIVTDTIDHLTSDGIVTASGKHLPCDLLVTATGFILQPLGGIALSVDGQPIEVGQHAAYKGIMLSDVPNLAFAVGYTNSSWTLKIGLLATHFTRLLRYMDERGFRVATPRFSGDFAATRPLLDFGAGYVKRNEDKLPRVLDEGTWTIGNRYVDDRKVLLKGRIDDPDLEFS